MKGEQELLHSTSTRIQTKELSLTFIHAYMPFAFIKYFGVKLQLTVLWGRKSSEHILRLLELIQQERCIHKSARLLQLSMHLHYIMMVVQSH